MNEFDYSIKGLIRQYGGWLRIFKSTDFIWAIICALLFLIYAKFVHIADLNIFIKDLASDLLHVSASLFGILFAAFAIILSLSDEKFMKFLRKHKVLNKILFPFWFVSILYIANIVLNILIRFIPAEYVKYLMVFSILTFSWAIFGTVYLINDTVNFGRRRADYLEFEKEIKEIESETMDKK